jgi:hypothetical protein
MASFLSVTALWVANQEMDLSLPLPLPLPNNLLSSLCRSVKGVVGFAGIYDLVMLDRDFPTYSTFLLHRLVPQWTTVHAIFYSLF